MTFEMPDLSFVAAGGLAAAVGATVQGSVGLGLGLVAAPIVTLFFPSLMPGSILVAAAVLPVFTLVREVRFADWRGLRWAFGGRIAGTPLGVWVVAALPPRALGMVVGGMVLAAVGITALPGGVPRSRPALVAAGVFSGATGTATSIGGPPLALLYQREEGPRIRATLAVFFTIGAVISLLTLAAVDQLPLRQVTAGLLLTPFALVGFAASGPVRRFLDNGRMRTGVLLITAVSALVLILRSLG
ncbi:MAG TPA: sulfite exporter TauE/SafE family protein [Actinomadura sp.]|nr:sulfite exporter TauE/SafE family protein [Actinomadura sp.]